MSTVKANTYQDASGGSNAILYGAASPAGSMGFRNRIINGDMRIDQRNAGAAVTVDGAKVYDVDRWFGEDGTDGAFTLEQSTTAPTGFNYSMKFTTTTADASLGATQYAYIAQRLEGYTVADLGFGSASAKTVTLSFWVRSSLTGTFGGSLQNSAKDRAYPFTYTISTADTWEQKTVTIAGDTTGTWLTTSGVGLQVSFGLGVGSTYSGTADAWAGANYVTATGATSVIGTLNATWYITGVQLEVGSVTTEFERRPYGTELSLCQRYAYVQSYAEGSYPIVFTGYWGTSTLFEAYAVFPVKMRSSPTVSVPTIGSLYALEAQVAWRQASNITIAEYSPTQCKLQVTAATNASFVKGQGGAVGLRATGTVEFLAEL